MTTRPQAPQPQTEEEALAILQEMHTKLQKQMTHQAGLVNQHAGALQQELDALNAELAQHESLMRELEALQTPAGQYHHACVRALHAGRSAYKSLLQLELQAAQANQGTLQGGLPADWDGESALFKNPAQDSRYLEARAAMDYYMAGFLWLTQLEVVDAFLRASQAEPAIKPASKWEEQAREARGQALAEILTADRNLQVALARTLEDLQVTQALLPWAKMALAGAAAISGREKWTLLQDRDWAKLNGAHATLLALPGVVAQHPALAAFDFSTPVPPDAVQEQEEDLAPIAPEDDFDIEIPGA